MVEEITAEKLYGNDFCDISVWGEAFGNSCYDKKGN